MVNDTSILEKCKKKKKKKKAWYMCSAILLSKNCQIFIGMLHKKSENSDSNFGLP